MNDRHGAYAYASHELHEGKSEIAYIWHYSPPDDQALVEVGLE